MYVCQKWESYLSVSSLWLNCLNLLCRIPICSKETEEQKKGLSWVQDREVHPANLPQQVRGLDGWSGNYVHLQEASPISKMPGSTSVTTEWAGNHDKLHSNAVNGTQLFYNLCNYNLCLCPVLISNVSFRLPDLTSSGLTHYTHGVSRVQCWMSIQLLFSVDAIFPHVKSIYSDVKTISLCILPLSL